MRPMSAFSVRFSDFFEILVLMWIVGKAMARWFHLARVYGLQGVFGTALLVTIFPALVVSNVATSTAVVASSPFWAPTVSFFRFAFTAFIVDLDRSRAPIPRIAPVLRGVIQILVQGVAQALLSFSAAVSLHPIASASLAIAATVRRACRRIFDTLMYGSPTLRSLCNLLGITPLFAALHVFPPATRSLLPACKDRASPRPIITRSPPRLPSLPYKSELFIILLMGVI